MSIGQHGDTLKPLHSIPPIKWHGQPIPERQWLVENWIPWGCVTALYGDGGTGKSLLAQQLLTSVATGTPFLGLPVRQCKVLGVFCEDDEDELHRRQAAINAQYGVEFGDLENMTFISRTSENNVMMTFSADGIGERTALYDQVLNLAKDSGVQFVVIDTVADTFGGNEIIRTHVQQFISHGLGGLAKAGPRLGQTRCARASIWSVRRSKPTPIPTKTPASSPGKRVTTRRLVMKFA